MDTEYEKTTHCCRAGKQKQQQEKSLSNQTNVFDTVEERQGYSYVIGLSLLTVLHC